MKSRSLLTVVALALAATCANTSWATTLTFDDIATGGNINVPDTHGSGITGDSLGFVTTDGTGATPDIDLQWLPQRVGDAPSANDIWEAHNSDLWEALDSTGNVHVVQIDVGPIGDHNHTEDPYIEFTPGAGAAVQFHSVDIGQFNGPTTWTITILRASDDFQVLSQTTDALGDDDTETVDLTFTGDAGVAYKLVFDDGGVNQNYAAIDDLSFSQIPVPEPSAFFLATAGLLGLIGFVRRRR